MEDHSLEIIGHRVHFNPYLVALKGNSESLSMKRKKHVHAEVTLSSCISDHEVRASFSLSIPTPSLRRPRFHLNVLVLKS